MKAKIEILDGMRFGKLVVLNEIEKAKNEKNRHNKWLCRCDCGNTTIVRSTELRNGKTKSCGCLNYARLVDLTGQRFGKLVVVQYAGRKGMNTMWKCQCDCGNITITTNSNLRTGSAKSCGCYKKVHSVTHGATRGGKRERLYKNYYGMINRCYNEHDKCFNSYGRKGIKVCDEWLNDFSVFRDWALSNGYQDDLTIDRINSNGNYEPLNCRWLTMKDNLLHKNKDSILEVNGELLTTGGWAKKIGVCSGTIRKRISEFGKEYTIELIKRTLVAGDIGIMYTDKKYRRCVTVKK